MDRAFPDRLTVPLIDFSSCVDEPMSMEPLHNCRLAPSKCLSLLLTSNTNLPVCILAARGRYAMLQQAALLQQEQPVMAGVVQG